jgi:VIT1/CCC1 family predicted Fe2+/Mn2+ transporter
MDNIIKLFQDPFFARNFVYGVQDSLISTSGVILGVSFANFSNRNIIITGYILILVEALSMGYGSFISEDAFMKTAKMKYDEKTVLKYGVVMFLSYALAGIIPLLPYIFNLKNPWIYTITLTFTTLLGLIYTFQHDIQKTIKQTFIGFLILIISLNIGKKAKSYN